MRMTGFCGVFLRPDVPPEFGRRTVESMLDAYGRDGHLVTVETPADALCLGFAESDAFVHERRRRGRIAGAEGRLTFGYFTLFARTALDPEGAARSDVDVVHRWRGRGGALGRVNGSFAGGEFTAADQRLDLFADQIGTQALLYAQCDIGLVFGNNARFLLGAGMPEPEVDLLGIAANTVLHYPGAGRFYLTGIQQVRQAHVLYAQAGAVTGEHCYWSLPETPDHGFRTAQDCVEHVRERLINAVEARVEDSVRPALLLSGGLDSSTIAGILAKRQPQREFLGIAHRPGPMAPRNDPNDDGPHIDRMDKAYENLKVVRFTSNHRDLFDGAADNWFDRAAVPCPEPFFFAWETNRQAALDHGADRLLDGYGGDMALSLNYREALAQALLTAKWDLAAREWQRLRYVAGQSTRAVIQHRVLPYLSNHARSAWTHLRHGHWLRAFPIARDWTDRPAFQNLMLEDDFFGGNPVRLALQHRILNHLPPSTGRELQFRDTVSGALGFRWHTPLLDTDLLEAVYWTPAMHFSSETTDRGLIRQVAAPFVPEEVLMRPGKVGAVQDIDHRKRTALPEMPERLMSYVRNAPGDQPFDIDRIMSFYKDYTQRESAARRSTALHFNVFFFAPIFAFQFAEHIRPLKRSKVAKP